MTWSHGQSPPHLSLDQLWINYPTTLYTEANREATEFTTKGTKNTFPMTQYARSQNQTDLPNQVVRRLHPVLQLPLHGPSSVLRTKIPKTRPAIQQMQVTKGIRIPPLLLKSHIWNMTLISKLPVTRMKQKTHVTIAHKPIGIFSMRINGKSINKNLATLHSCLLHCKGKGEYGQWLLFWPLFFPDSSSLRHLYRCTKTSRQMHKG